MYWYSLYLIFISNDSKNNKWVSHRSGVWGLARKRIGCYYGLVQVRSHTDCPILPINDLFLSRLFAWILTHFSDLFCLCFFFSICIYISIYRFLKIYIYLYIERPTTYLQYLFGLFNLLKQNSLFDAFVLVFFFFFFKHRV